jgi:multidrug resistance efflux pump
MTDTELKSDRAVEQAAGARDLPGHLASDSATGKPRIRIVPILVTLAAICVAVPLGWAMWHVYMLAPWTRDGTIRVHVVTMAPEVSGRIVELPVVDNQFVHKGDLLMVIDPVNYQIAVTLAEAGVQQAQVVEENLGKEAKRRLALSDLSVSQEQQQTYESQAVASHAQSQQAQATLEQARVNFWRTQIRSPVNGWVTNLIAQTGDYANIGKNEITVVDADSFWIDGYFEETSLGSIHEGDPAEAKLMGYRQVIRGHVESIARGISIANAEPSGSGLALVNPIFTWVRLAQRIPVHIRIDEVPDGVRLVSGTTASVQIDPKPAEQPAK